MTEKPKSTMTVRKPTPQPDSDLPGRPSPTPAPDLPETPRPVPPEAQRALAEAEERRKKADALKLPPELGGREGPEPVRYGDWEKKGIAVDF